MLLNVILAANSRNRDDSSNTCRLSSTHSLPGTALSCLYVKIHLILTTTPENRHYYPLLTDEETEAQTLGDLSKVTGLLSGKATCLSPSPRL